MAQLETIILTPYRIFLKPVEHIFLTFSNIALHQSLPSQPILLWYIHFNDTYSVYLW